MHEIKSTLATRGALSIAFLLLLLGCANDIKGEKGDTGAAGQDASAAIAVSLRRPDFYSKPADANVKELIVPATNAQPSRVAINGTIYSNSANAVLNVDNSVRNGIDAGTVAINSLYYLYAIPAESGTGFDLIASLNDPNSGPVGFAGQATYLGAFITDGGGAAEIIPFTSVGGNVQMNQGNYAFDVNITETTIEPNITEYTLKVPIGAKIVRLRAHMVSPTPDDSLSLSSHRDSSITALKATSATGTIFQYLSWPITHPQKIYGYVTQAADNASLRILGWIENPAEYP